MLIWCFSVKGGVGTSVVAAAAAERLARAGHDTTLLDLAGDQPALLGVADEPRPEPGISDWLEAGSDVAADALARLQEQVAPRLRLLRAGTTSIGSAGSPRLALALEVLTRAGVVVVDAGLRVGLGAGLDCGVVAAGSDGFRDRFAGSSRWLCVLRPCFLALKRAQPVVDFVDQVVLVNEPGRALRPSDVAAAVGNPRVDSVAWTASVARSVDAGTILAKLPAPLQHFKLPNC